MSSILRRNPLAVVLAVLMHVAIIAFLVVGVDWRKAPQPQAVSGQPVQAKLVDESRLKAEVERLKKKQEEKVAAERKEAERLAELKKRREAEKRELARLEQERKAREAREKKEQAEARKRAEAEKARLAKLEQERKARAAELAALKKKQAAEKKREQEEQARRKREEAERRRALEEEQRRKAEAERKKKAEELARQRASEEAERKRREAELQGQIEAERLAGEIERYKIAVNQKVSRNWLRPPGTSAGLVCVVRVRLLPGGGVLAANVLVSSGNGSFDRSVVAAVIKADPLPPPPDPAIRELDLRFDPSAN
jgi:colicin import membrane protein